MDMSTKYIEEVLHSMTHGPCTIHSTAHPSKKGSSTSKCLLSDYSFKNIALVTITASLSSNIDASRGLVNVPYYLCNSSVDCWGPCHLIVKHLRVDFDLFRIVCRHCICIYVKCSVETR